MDISVALTSMDSSSLLPPSGDGDEPLCYLCLDTGVGQPLLRDCARCGTDAGFVHLSCLTKKYAAAKSMQTVEMTEFVQPWETCPGCHPILLERARSRYCVRVCLVRSKAVSQHTKKQVEALLLKLCAFDSILERLTPVQMREAGVTANVLLSLIDRMKRDTSPIQMRFSHLKADAHGVHGRIALMREQKRVQGERWFTLKTSWGKCVNWLC